MTLDDRLTIATPEGIDVDLVLAGLGSRLIARLVDTAVQFGIIIPFAFLTSAVQNGWFLAVVFIVSFLAIFAYDVAFEVLGSGRTIGKRAAGLQVVRSGGQPVNFGASLIRNVFRLVDFLPSLYLLGAFCILATRANQRLGDLAAGTVVVRERRGRRQTTSWASYARPTVPIEAVAGWDVSAVTPAEVAALRAFVDRRLTLPNDTRYRIACELADAARREGHRHPCRRAPRIRARRRARREGSAAVGRAPGSVVG